MVATVCNTLVELANSPTVHSVSIAVIIWVTIAVVKR